ncbi:DUF4365 domain-containing protein [Psychroserpens algicola]|uniref:DUF4365 domain-containing protein n=1 Tax=Psychroserpens algicola TaxID=1719034 RepID=A0ABT0H9B4_9FLAO|nr:DUF4365 domain-containing protein [Psychroserpens algicola]MCK8480953.1 DUF4365 domain-containing protein [Psychroserpens algicola]
MKRDNREIQKDADDLLKGQLRKLFKENNLKLGENPSTEGEEKGIDFFFEVFSRTTDSHEFLLLNQNKGTDTEVSPITKKGHPEINKISFQLEVRHAKYFYFELNEPLIFTLCDINKGLVYWYSIQLDNLIPERIEKQVKEEKETLQIYISPENILNSKNFSLFLKDISYSKGSQIRKHKEKFNFKADYNWIKTKTEGLHIIDSVYETLQLFQLPVIPTSIIRRIPTISGSYYKSYINDSTFKTDNEDFFNLIYEIKLVKDELRFSEGSLVENQEEKLKAIIDFFKLNTIYHLEWNGKKRKERICVHYLFTYGDCNCERCNYDRLNFAEAKSILENTIEDRDNLERLREGYTYYLLGDLKKSINIFKKLNNDSHKENNPIIYTVTKYNLIHLKRFLKYNYSGSDSDDIEKELDGVNFELDELFVSNYAPHFLEFFNQFKNDAYFDNSFRKVDNLLTEIQKISFQDKLGGRFSNSKVSELKVGFLRALCFLEFNYVIFNSFHEYKILANKVLEGFIALYTLKNPASSNYKEFDIIIMIMWLFHADFKQTNHLLHKYQLKSLNVVKEDNFYIKFSKYTNNIVQSSEHIKNAITEKNYLFTDKVELITSNMILILSRVELNSKNINSLIETLLDFIETMDSRSFLNDDAIYQLVNFQRDINKENVSRIISLLKTHDYIYSSAFSSSIRLFSEIGTEEEVGNLLIEFVGTSDFSKDELLKDDDTAQAIGLIIDNLDSGTQKNIRKIIKEELKLIFNPDFFYLYTIYEVIDFDSELFNKFIENVPDDTKKDERIKSFIGDSWYYNYRLDQVINLMYHFDMPFDKKLRKLSKKTNSKNYYDWLMNLEGYDYTNFDVYWILKHKTDSYFKAFNKSKKMKKIIQKSLKENYIEGVAKIYFNMLA